ncbi:hypothetical protein EV356DRAFT_519107 [Viridothelium virens]|uniref:Uncharacterized protein n=1 Tax=Viridothelium virens TaxID=1048519 RepID=A0A6A6GZQ8_VIRVR|nr:hypothetical protein EV356DRAFT_519107 [Viridothelium virens]
MSPDTAAAVLFSLSAVFGVGIVVVGCGLVFGWFHCGCLHRRRDGGGRIKQGTSSSLEVGDGFEPIKLKGIDLERGFSVKSAVPAGLSFPPPRYTRGSYVAIQELRSSSSSSSGSAQHLLASESGEAGSVPSSEDGSSRRSSHERRSPSPHLQPPQLQLQTQQHVSSCSSRPSSDDEGSSDDDTPPTPPPKDPTNSIIRVTLAPPLPTAPPDHQPGLHSLPAPVQTFSRSTTRAAARRSATAEQSAPSRPTSLTSVYTTTTAGGIRDSRTHIDAFHNLSRFTHDRWSFASSIANRGEALTHAEAYV